MDGSMLPEKKLAQAALHGACGALDQTLLQLSNVALGRTIRVGEIGGRYNGLDTVLFL